MKILIIEDDLLLSDSLADMLSDHGFSVEQACDASEAFDFLSSYSFQAVILDLGLPDMKGEACLKQIRADHPVLPILILSGRDDLDMRLTTLEAGADDYMIKPYQSPELVARLRANIRRANGYGENILAIGDLQLDLRRQLVEANGRTLNLTRKEFEVLRLLFLQKGGVVAKSAFLDHLYGGMDEPEIKIIDVFICKLRKKLDAALGGAPLIETVWGRGYRVCFQQAA